MVDEAHHTPAATFAKVVSWLPCRYRYGLSATPIRRDGLHALIQRSIGPILSKVDHDTVEKSGSIVGCAIQELHTGFAPDCDEWHEFITAIVEDDDRNKLIVDRAHHLSSYTPVLILTDRIDHAETLAELLPNSVLIHGQLPAKIKPIRFKEMTTATITIGTYGLLGEGLDCASWGGLIRTTPASNEVKLKQAVGRLIRPSAGKKKGYRSTVNAITKW